MEYLNNVVMHTFYFERIHVGCQVFHTVHGGLPGVQTLFRKVHGGSEGGSWTLIIHLMDRDLELPGNFNTEI